MVQLPSVAVWIPEGEWNTHKYIRSAPGAFRSVYRSKRCRDSARPGPGTFVQEAASEPVSCTDTADRWNDVPRLPGHAGRRDECERECHR